MEEVNLHSSSSHVSSIESHTVIGGFQIRRRNALIAAVVVVVTLAILIPVLVLKPGSSSSSSGGSVASSVDSSLYDQLKNTYERSDFGPLDVNALDDKDSPQYKAFVWLANNANLDSYDHGDKLVRYALACFYYSTYEVETPYSKTKIAWKDSTGWLSNDNVCEWRGIECNSRNQVIGIDLENNDLTGNLPPEMVWLPHMETLDLTTNLLYLEGPAQLAVLGAFPNLESLLVDDNFIVTDTGLPESIGNLQKLEKLRLSYNLLRGPLNNGVLDKLGALTHLEIESNFLEGNMPSVIGENENLIYLYARRNALTFDLEFLKSGKMKSIFSMWLDSNNVIGTIPTEIGLLTELASLSLTDSSLTGTLPTELGNLSGLRRFWIYKNQLKGQIPTEMNLLNKLEVFQAHDNSFTGEMPAGVCDTLEAATYASKSLTADCQEVTCDACCTQCFP